METLRDLDLVRAVNEPDVCEFRDAVESGDTLGTLEVRFSPFKTWYRIQSFWEGDFMERTWPGAFRKTISENLSAMRVQFDHGHDPHIGSKVLGEIMSLQEMSRGPVGEVDLFDTSYNRDLLPGLKRGAYGSSFRFRVIKDEWNDEPGQSDHNPAGIPERTIKEVRLMEFGPVTWPANPAATAGVRSLTDAYYEQLRAIDPKGYDDLRSRAVALRERTAAEGTVPPAGAAQQNADEPPVRHSDGYTPQQRRALLYPILAGKAEQ